MTPEELQAGIDVWSDPESTATFLKGRVALYALLRAAGIGPGDEVLVPGFTCFVVPAAVHYTGANAVYYDIDPKTFNGDPSRVAAGIGERTRALVVQHSFGHPFDPAPLVEECRQRQIVIIEDCAHAIGPRVDGRPVGALGDGAFCSLQWSKPATAGLGGIARANTDALRAGVLRVHASFREPSAIQQAILRALLLGHSLLYRPSLFWALQGAYRWAGGRGLVRGSSDRCEFESATMPPDYERRFGQARRGDLRRALASIRTAAPHRRAIANHYATALDQLGVPLASPPPGHESIPLRVPVRVANRLELLAHARSERVELGDWFNAPLHPAETQAEAFGYHRGMCPHAERAATEIVNLPTHERTSFAEADRIVEFLRRHAELVGVEPAPRAQGLGSDSARRGAQDVAETAEENVA